MVCRRVVYECFLRSCLRAAYAHRSLFALVKSSPAPSATYSCRSNRNRCAGVGAKCKRFAGVDDLPFRSSRLQHTCGSARHCCCRVWVSHSEPVETLPPQPHTSPPPTCARSAHCVGCFGLRVLFASHTLVSTHTPHARAAPKRIAVLLAFLQRRATLGRRDAAHHHRPPRRPRRSPQQQQHLLHHLLQHRAPEKTRVFSAVCTIASSAASQRRRASTASQWRRPHPGYAFSQVSSPYHTHTQYPAHITASAAHTVPCSALLLLHNLQRPPPTLAVSETHFSSAAKYSPSQSFARSVRAWQLLHFMLTPTRRNTQWRKTIS